MRNLVFLPLAKALHIVMASAAAVDSSSRDELAISIPVKSDTIVWKFRSASNLINHIFSHSDENAVKENAMWDTKRVTSSFKYYRTNILPWNFSSKMATILDVLMFSSLYLRPMLGSRQEEFCTTAHHEPSLNMWRRLQKVPKSNDGGIILVWQILPALGNLCLVWSVLCVPTRILKKVPLDDRRNICVIVAHPNIRFENFVLQWHGPARQESRICSNQKSLISRIHAYKGGNPTKLVTLLKSRDDRTFSKKALPLKSPIDDRTLLFLPKFSRT